MRRLVAICALVGILASGCFSIHSVEVHNRSAGVIYVSMDIDCANPGATRSQTIRPGQHYQGGAFSMWNVNLDCLVIRDANRVEVFRERVPEGGVYQVSGSGPMTVSWLSAAESYEFGAGWTLLLVFAPFVLGMPFALFFTGQFFWRFYVSKSIT
jgi:hypothetical protein